MSKVTINYSDIRTASRRAKSVSNYYEDFEEDLTNKVSKKLNDLCGSDSRNNIENAKSIVSEKIKELKNSKQYYSELADSLSKLADNVEYEEKSIVTDVRYIATNALELNRQSIWQAFTQWAYGTFCVDALNWNPITRFFGNGIKRGYGYIKERTIKVVDWFKHGQGKYLFDISMDVLSGLGAILGTLATIVLAVGTGGAAAPLVVAAVASTIGTIMTIVDTGFSVVNKVKALEIQSDTSDPGRARYYGKINGVNDQIKKKDMGDKTANNVWETIGSGYDVLHTAAEITAMVSGTIGEAGFTGEIATNPLNEKKVLKTTYNSSLVKDNLKKKYLELFGFKNTNGKWTFDAKKLLITKKTKVKAGTIKKTDLLKNNLMFDTIGSKKYDELKKAKQIISLPNKLYNGFKQTSKIVSHESTVYDRVKSTMKIIGDIDYFRITSPVKDINNTVIKIIDTTIGLAS